MAAREEEAREDLLAEATALVRRVEWRIPGADEPVVIGFRRDGAASVFFGQSPAYHFTTRGELRRAYIEPLLYKAEQGRIVSLRRERTEHQTALVRHELSPDEQEQFLAECSQRLWQFGELLSSGELVRLRQVPVHDDVQATVAAWLAQLAHPPRVAASPRVS